MEEDKWCIRVCAWAVMFALAVRLIWSNGLPGRLVQGLKSTSAVAALMYLETGRPPLLPRRRPLPCRRKANRRC